MPKIVAPSLASTYEQSQIRIKFNKSDSQVRSAHARVLFTYFISDNKEFNMKFPICGPRHYTGTGTSRKIKLMLG
jgi:hypothetical protein